MFYSRLLSSMLSGVVPTFVSPVDSLDLASFWRFLGLDPFQEFSSSLTSYLETFKAPDGAPPITGVRCITDLVYYWQDRMRGFCIVGVDQELTLIYHRLGSTGGYQGRIGVT